jgi:3-deoxy-D-manno-octulosonate 8-phosphate phosphatase (KDO 8-P phosphatase)
LREKLQKIRMILFDVDGVLCSGDITYLDNGTEVKTFDVQDGMGITLAEMAGLKTGIITGRKSKAIDRRAAELKIDYLSQGSFHKIDPYLDILKNSGMADEEVCYIGDDVLDLPILERVGFSVAVANARDEVKAACDYVTVACGGRGAVREVIDLILKRQHKFDVLLSSLRERKMV